MHLSIRSTGLYCAAVVCLFTGLFVPNAFSKEEMTARDSLKHGQLLLDRGGFEKALPSDRELALAERRHNQVTNAKIGLRSNNAFKEYHNLLFSTYNRFEPQRSVNHGVFGKARSGAFQLSGLL